mmetsp:Transcript_34673/g.81283  ORF Transcript_34673/g.81283 Transcript_34673/m.81283 type:complete len:259 (-) Transcript_34673:10-786(-)
MRAAERVPPISAAGSISTKHTHNPLLGGELPLHLHEHLVLLGNLLLQGLDSGLVLSKLPLSLQLLPHELLPALLPRERLRQLNSPETHPHARGEGGAKAAIPKPTTIAAIHRRRLHDHGGGPVHHGRGRGRRLGGGRPAGGRPLEATPDASTTAGSLRLGGGHGRAGEHSPEEAADDGTALVEAVGSLLLHAEAARRSPGGGAGREGRAGREGIGATKGSKHRQSSNKNLGEHFVFAGDPGALRLPPLVSFRAPPVRF